MLEVLIGIVLLALGFWAGRKTAAREKPPAPRRPEAQELQRLQEDKAAFDLLMGYSAQRAYGAEDDGN